MLGKQGCVRGEQGCVCMGGGGGGGQGIVRGYERGRGGGAKCRDIEVIYGRHILMPCHVPYSRVFQMVPTIAALRP